MADLKISEWKCSYYDASRKKWLSGILQLTKSRIRVLTPPPKRKAPVDSSQAVYMTVALDNITDIRKATSGYVFKCVVVTGRDGQHWFSSLPVRDNVYNILNHFWRNRLMPTPEKRHSFPSNSKRGAELLQLAQDPEQSLLEAGEMLMKQGEQMEYLVFEEKPQGVLASWFSKWRVPKEYLKEGIEFVNSKGIPIVHEFPVLFCRGETTKTPEKVLQTPGIVRVSKDGISILTEGQVPCHYFKPKDVTVVKILTPWRIVIANYRSNEMDVSYIVTSSHMVKLIRVLEVQYKKRFDIEEVPENVEQTFRMSGQNRESLHEELMKAGAKINLSSMTADDSLDIIAENKIVVDGEISAEEAEELNKMLCQMKMNAMEIEEDDLQMDALDDLVKDNKQMDEMIS